MSNLDFKEKFSKLKTETEYRNCQECGEVHTCKNIYFNDGEKTHTKWFCRDCFIKLNNSLHSLKRSLEGILKEEERKLSDTHPLNFLLNFLKKMRKRKR